MREICIKMFAINECCKNMANSTGCFIAIE